MATAAEANGVQVTPERIIPAIKRMVAQIDDELDTSRELVQLTVLLDRRRALPRCTDRTGEGPQGTQASSSRARRRPTGPGRVSDW